MSARIVLALAAVLAAGQAPADDMHKVAPMEKVDSGATSSPGTTWTKSESSSGSPAYSFEASSDNARPRTGSQSSSSAGQRHTGASSRGGESQTSAPPQTDAQRRHPRPGTGTGHFDNNGHHGGGYGGYYGYPYYGYGRYGYGYGFGYGYPYAYYSPFYFSGYYGYGPSYYVGGGYGSYRESGSLRIIVDPSKARVYVDGYYAGVVDDFDGVFQRLNIPPGRHEITLKLEGYRTQHFKVYVPVGDTIKIHYDMVTGSGEATSEQFAGVPVDYARAEDMNDRNDDRYDRRDDGRYEGRDDTAGDTGSVRLQVSPQDASVYVDGEFRGSGRQSTNLKLRPGRHRIEVVRPGFRTVERDVEVEPGRSTEVEVELEKL